MKELAITVETVAEEIEAAISVNATSAREYHIRVFWETGKIIRDSKLPVTKLLTDLAQTSQMKHFNMDERSLWYAVKIFDYAPNFEKIYETNDGQNISVSKLKRLVSGGKEEEKQEPTDKEIVDAFIKKHGYDRAQKLAKLILQR